jgi:outer membrane immunogenic protein
MNTCRVVCAAAVLTTISTVALSADIAEMYVEPEPLHFDWTGAYVGVHAGWGWAQVDGVFDISELDEEFPDGSETTFLDDMDADGLVGGLHAGYNFQRGAFVFGPEGDLTFVSIDGEAADAEGDDVARADIDLLASLRLRGGVALDRLLLYATGGVAYARGEFQLIDNLGAGSENRGTADFDAWGGVAGGGIEYAFTDRMSLRLEGLHYFFDDVTNTSNLTDDSDPGDFAELRGVTVVRVGLSIGF